MAFHLNRGRSRGRDRGWGGGRGRGKGGGEGGRPGLFEARSLALHLRSRRLREEKRIAG